MKVLGIILFAHGSRDPLWRQPMEAVATRLRTRGITAACAYLELTEPDLTTAVDELVNSGVNSIRVVPLFLGVGRHAREDLPLLMSEIQARHSTVIFELQQAVSEDERLLDMLADIACT